MKAATVATALTLAAASAANAVSALERFIGGPYGPTFQACAPRFIDGVRVCHACFQRVDDDAQLSGHPLQNVRAIKVRASAASDDPDSLSLDIAVAWRAAEGVVARGVSCFNPERRTGAAALVRCRVDGEYGTIIVELRADRPAQFVVPVGARRQPPGQAAAAGPQPAFGAGDARFRLDRAPVAACDSAFARTR